MATLTPGLGAAAEVVERVAAVFEELADGSSGRGRVMLDEVGAVVVSPLGAELFNDDDAVDRAVVAKLLTGWSAAFAAAGWRIGKLAARPDPDALVSFARCAPLAERPPLSWSQLALTTAEHLRWARRRRDADAEPVREPGQNAPPPTVVERESRRTIGCVARLQRPLVGVPCVPVAPDGRMRCPRCAAVTVVTEAGVVGPRLPECVCWGEDVPLCAHPGASPTSPTHSHPGQRSRRASPAAAGREGR